jgi:ADP-ribose pyrophosphatase YjhB (NUDIX family)
MVNRRVAVRGIVLHAGKLLAVQLKSYKDNVLIGESDHWCLPGGGLEEGESLVEGIRREMLEETGIEPAIGKLLYVQQFAHRDTEHLEFFFYVMNGNDYLSVDLSKASHGEREIARIAFVDASQTEILPEFLSVDDLSAFAAGNEPVRVISRL